MKHIVLSAALLMGIFSMGQQAEAQTTPGQTQKRQTARIREGVQSGELTRREAQNLKADQREIRQDIRQAKADGTVTKGERTQIKQEQRQASREIARKKHNSRSRR